MLKEGDKAPSFDLASDEGGTVSLRDFAGKALVLYFYPRDNTPGCTREAQAFTAARRAIEKAGGAVVGISRDSLKSHESFRQKCKLGITLLSDPDLTVHKAYGAWGEKSMYGKKVEGVLRSTFIVKNGKIARLFPNVRVDGHAEAVLEALRDLAKGSPKTKKATTTAKADAKKRSARSSAKPKRAMTRPASTKKN